MFHLMFVHYTFSSVWLLWAAFWGYGCPLGWQFVLVVFCLMWCLFVSRLFIYYYFFFLGGGRFLLLIAPVPVHCFSISSKSSCS